jgi:hypothetical protein
MKLCSFLGVTRFFAATRRSTPWRCLCSHGGFSAERTQRVSVASCWSRLGRGYFPRSSVARDKTALCEINVEDAKQS